MNNYFSFGRCAQIGFEFDHHRTDTRTCNNCQYIIAGLKTALCGCIFQTPAENIPVREMVSYLEGEDPTKPGKMQRLDMNQEADCYVRGEPISIVATNITSYMGGYGNPWPDALGTERMVGGGLAHEVNFDLN
jgi:hypothetical protein